MATKTTVNTDTNQLEKIYIKSGNNNPEEVYLFNINNSPAFCKRIKYLTGTLTTGITSITCHRKSSPKGFAEIGIVINDSYLYYGDEIYFTAKAEEGYDDPIINQYYDENHTLSIGVTHMTSEADIIGSNYVQAGPLTNYVLKIYAENLDYTDSRYSIGNSHVFGYSWRMNSDDSNPKIDFANYGSSDPYIYGNKAELSKLISVRIVASGSSTPQLQNLVYDSSLNCYICNYHINDKISMFIGGSNFVYGKDKDGNLFVQDDAIVTAANKGNETSVYVDTTDSIITTQAKRYRKATDDVAIVAYQNTINHNLNGEFVSVNYERVAGLSAPEYHYSDLYKWTTTVTKDNSTGLIDYLFIYVNAAPTHDLSYRFKVKQKIWKSWDLDDYIINGVYVDSGKPADQNNLANDGYAWWPVGVDFNSTVDGIPWGNRVDGGSVTPAHTLIYTSMGKFPSTELKLKESITTTILSKTITSDLNYNHSLGLYVNETSGHDYVVTSEDYLGNPGFTCGYLDNVVKDYWINSSKSTKGLVRQFQVASNWIPSSSRGVRYYIGDASIYTVSDWEGNNYSSIIIPEDNGYTTIAEYTVGDDAPVVTLAREEATSEASIINLIGLSTSLSTNNTYRFTVAYGIQDADNTNLGLSGDQINISAAKRIIQQFNAYSGYVTFTVRNANSLNVESVCNTYELMGHMLEKCYLTKIELVE